ncbi:tight junction protein ZO-3 isoform X2 [Ornithorhynchus anatinus]|nr:tight junction protein ZO-3 isoform X2 [Ornithorhynchus anatinus]
MEELMIWEQYTVTLSKDPRRGFGIAISGGRDRPSGANRDVSVVVSDVVSGGPADGRLQTRDHIVMVNGVSMENVSSAFAIQTLKSCVKLADITVKRPRKIQLPVTKAHQPSSSPPSGLTPTTHRYDSDEEYSPRGQGSSPQSRGRYSGHRPPDDVDHNRGYDGDSSSERSSGHYRDERSRRNKGGRRSRAGSYRRRGSQDSGSDRTDPSWHRSSCDPDDETEGLALVSGFKRLPRQDVLMKPVKSILVKKKESEEFGLKLGSQIYIKHISDTGLAAQKSSLQEGDLVLKINGVSSENLSLTDTRQLIEKSEGVLTLLVLRDNRQFLVNIPPVLSDSDSSRLEDISDIGSELSQAPPSHVPPPPRGDRWSDSPQEGRRLQQEKSVESRDAQETHGKRSFDHTCRGPGSREDDGYCPDTKVVRFTKAKSIGLRLAGGNDVGIFVSGVQEGSPADGQGIKEGDQILQVNDTAFQNLTREEAVTYLLNLPPGEEMVLQTQCKQDIYRKMIKSNVGDSFYIRTHFELEPSEPSGLGFTRGEVFHVVDTLYRGRMGSWLAMRMGRELQEMEKGIIPNQSRAEHLANQEAAQRAMTAQPSSSGARAEFWKLRGLRGAKKNLRKSREDLSALTEQGHYPPYERVVLKEASFKRPVVILGPLADVAMQKLSIEMPDQFEIAESVSREGGPSKVIKLDTVRVIAEKDKHALLDVIPSAVERLNYVQYYPIVVFCNPGSRAEVKALRQWLVPTSKKSSRRLYTQATKMRKYCSHLFTATINLSGNNNIWYQDLKDIIKTQQSRPIWTAEDQMDTSSEENLELPHQNLGGSTDYLSCDSRANSDYEETDGEGGAYTDNDMDEEPREPALARSSEPVMVNEAEGQREQPMVSLTHPTQQVEDHPSHVQDHRPQGQWRPDQSIRAYEHEALKKKFTRARAYDSDEDDGYDWGPATDL